MPESMWPSTSAFARRAASCSSRSTPMTPLSLTRSNATAIIGNRSRSQSGQFSAVTALAVDENGELIGTRFPQDPTDASALEIRFRYKVKGDKAGSSGRRCFAEYHASRRSLAIAGSCQRASVWNAIARRYKERYVNEILKITWLGDPGTGCRTRPPIPPGSRPVRCSGTSSSSARTSGGPVTRRSNSWSRPLGTRGWHSMPAARCAPNGEPCIPIRDASSGWQPSRSDGPSMRWSVADGVRGADGVSRAVGRQRRVRTWRPTRTRGPIWDSSQGPPAGVCH